MLHVIYRSYGGENRKGRPDYYSKMLSLASLVRSFREVAPGQAELIFLNDGPIPADRLRLMEMSGQVLARSKLGLRGSMREALALPTARGWPVSDLVWLSEDDYLYLPRALPDLIAAAEACSDAAYFGLYALIGSRLPSGGTFEDPARVPKGWRQSEPVLVRGHAWRRALSTASTFGARVGPLVADRMMMLLAMRTGGAWDHTTSLMYQGFSPYPIRALRHSFHDAAGTNNWPHRAAVLVARLGLNVYQAARRATPVQLVAADPSLATHLETQYLAQGTDWRAAAEDTQSWLNAVDH